MRSHDECSLSGFTLPAVLALVAVAAAATLLDGCTDAPGAEANPNAGLLRDFLDGKYDSAGHPLNARTTPATALCANHAAICEGPISGGEQQGDLIANARMHVHAHPTSGVVVTIDILDQGNVVASEKLTAARVRGVDVALDLPVSWTSTGHAVTARITPAAGASITLDYIEVFPKRFGLVLSPGSGTITDTGRLTFELSRNHKIDRLEINGTESTARINQLIATHHAGSTTTAFRTLIQVRVADLVPARTDITELKVTAGDTARMQLRRTAPACLYEGDPTGKKVLITGFQPFPADGWHENISGVAVTALDPSALHGANVMRIVMPVEYDRAAAEVTDAIARCQPDIVISFGQGGNDIALEQVAYNLQDTGEVAGGVPDNRGIVRAAVPIDVNAPATRGTLLPLDKIEQAIVALGEAPQHSTDPGRYICNNVMFADIGAMAGRRAGFIHLPYTSQFDDAVRARFAKVVAAAIQATVDAN